MNIKETEFLLTEKVKEKLDAINYRITSIMTHFSKEKLLRDGTTKDVFVTGFYEPLFDSRISVISDPETLEMLYVQTGAMTFADIDHFFKKEGE